MKKLRKKEKKTTPLLTANVDSDIENRKKVLKKTVINTSFLDKASLKEVRKIKTNKANPAIPRMINVCKNWLCGLKWFDKPNSKLLRE